ncbi:unnamed protein product [Rotaria sp. Silwood2]|nr:unnamed protein product [Rotaria sp. Silwood2]
MATSSKKKNDPTIEALSALIEDPSTAENDKAKYIYKRIYINYEKKNWNTVIEGIKMYQQITKSKKLEILKIKSEIQEFCHKSRKTLMELNDDDGCFQQFLINVKGQIIR